jgi:mono/diheme cytochrome c family protein
MVSVMKKSVFALFSSLLTISLFIQCKKDNVESKQQNQAKTCDTTNVTYSKIASILNANSCAGCHGSGTSVPLNSYDNVKTAALSGRLIGAVEHLTGYNPMPNSSQKISECDRTTIKAWINQGTKN